MSTCRDCGATIDWIRMRSGKMMPVDPEPVFVSLDFVTPEYGTQTFITDEGEMISGTATEENTGEVGFALHWETCPERNKFRR